MQNSSLQKRIELNEAETFESIRTYFKEDTEFTFLLKPLLDALGWPGHHRHLVETLPHFNDHLDITNFMNVMAKLNYKNYSIKGKLSEINESVLPCLFVPHQEDAFVIVSKKQARLSVWSSAKQEKIEIPQSNLEGTIYIFKQNDDTNDKVSKNWFLDILSRYRLLFYQICVVSMLLNLFLLAAPIFIMSAYDKVIPSGSQDMIFYFMLGAGIFLVGAIILQSMRAHMIAYIAARLDITIGETIFEHLMYLAPSYTESASVGSQIARIKDFDMVREFISSPFVTTLFELPFTIVALIVIALLAGEIVFIPIIMMLIFLGFFVLTYPLVNRVNQLGSIANSEKETFKIETLTNLRAVKAVSSEHIWQKRFKEKSSRATYCDFRSTFLSFILDSISDAIVMISGLVVIYVGVQQVIANEMTAGTLIAIMMLVWRTLSPIKTFFSMLPKLNQINSSLNQINRLIKIKVERDPNKVIMPIQPNLGKVDFQRVSFRYRSDLPPALLGATISIQPGELTCVIGKNGSGKSTLCKLITQMYIPQGGVILLDNTNIKQIDPIELRHAIAYLPQNTNLFFGTISQNLKFSKITASDEEMIQACKMAGVYEDVIKLPLGFDTHIDDCSKDLYSACFKQKIALARTYLKASPIMVLDEPTNHFNYRDDEQFVKTINELKGKVSILLITHRPAHMRLADKIFYFDQGYMVLQGRPADVLPKLPLDLL